MRRLAWAATLMLVGCASTYPGHSTYPAHSNPVFVTEENITGIPYVVIDTITYQKQFYGSFNDMAPDIAKLARNLGADAVVDVHKGANVTLFSWASPYLHGTAVKFKDPESATAELIRRGYRQF